MPDEIEVLFRLHATPLMRLATLLSGDRPTAEDAVQEAFIRFHRVDPSPEPGSEFAYLRRTVVNICNDGHRRRGVARRHLERTSTEIAHAGPTHPCSEPELRAERSEQQTVVLRAIGTLAHRQRQCVVLTYYEQCPETEVADLLGISVGSVKTHLHRARATLAEALEDHR